MRRRTVGSDARRFEVASVKQAAASGGAPGLRRAAGWRALAPRIAEWILLALIAFLLARAAMAFFAPLPLPKGDRLAAATGSASEKPQIEGRNPFPASGASAAPAASPSESVAETALDLGLTGVWPAEQTPSAIIRRPDGKQRRYAVGEEIVSGVRLVEVQSDYVIIEQNGVRESLRFENKAPIERAAPVERPAPPPTDAPEKIENLTPQGSLNNLVRFGLGLDPKGGAAVMIFAGRNRAAFEQAGFRDGDIVRSINGVAPSPNPAEMSALINQIVSAGSASVVVERDGASRTLTLSLSELGKE
jgi:general secretion pathway protein C